MEAEKEGEKRGRRDKKILLNNQTNSERKLKMQHLSAD